MYIINNLLGLKYFDCTNFDFILFMQYILHYLIVILVNLHSKCVENSTFIWKEILGTIQS